MLKIQSLTQAERAAVDLGAITSGHTCYPDRAAPWSEKTGPQLAAYHFFNSDGREVALWTPEFAQCSWLGYGWQTFPTSREWSHENILLLRNVMRVPKPRWRTCTPQPGNRNG